MKWPTPSTTFIINKCNKNNNNWIFFTKMAQPTSVFIFLLALLTFEGLLNITEGKPFITLMIRTKTIIKSRWIFYLITQLKMFVYKTQLNVFLPQYCASVARHDGIIYMYAWKRYTCAKLYIPYKCVRKVLKHFLLNPHVLLW